jgi:ABC-type branched-subunit amino acid transport system substrate-binding protein
MGNGMRLAARQISALGGPQINFAIQDNGSGTPTAGAEAARATGNAGIAKVLSSQSFNVGSALPAIEQFKMFTLDPGGGSFFFFGKPFAWGAKAIVYYDSVAGAMEWVAQSKKGTKIAYVGVDLGQQFTTLQVNRLKQEVTKNNLQLVGQPETAPLGATDYSTVISRINNYNPDVISAFLYGNDAPFFTKQYVQSGGKATVVGSDYTLAAAKIAGDAYKDFYFAMDYFPAGNPPNDWSKAFVDEYTKAYGSAPDAYAAGFYESMFIHLATMRRVVDNRGDINSGVDMDKAFREHLVFNSVFGGSGSTIGTIAFNETTHSVQSRPSVLLNAHIDQPQMLATFDIDGSNFKLV